MTTTSRLLIKANESLVTSGGSTHLYHRIPHSFQVLSHTTRFMSMAASATSNSQAAGPPQPLSQPRKSVCQLTQQTVTPGEDQTRSAPLVPA
jgi:hypothetical protein